MLETRRARPASSSILDHWSPHATDSMTATLLVLAGALGAHNAFAQAAGLHRTDLVHHDLSVPGREALQVRVDFDERAFAPAHVHPGEEIAHVLQGTIEYRLDGQPL